MLHFGLAVSICMMLIDGVAFGQTLPTPPECYSHGEPWTPASIEACHQATQKQEDERQRADQEKWNKSQAQAEADAQKQAEADEKEQANASPALLKYENLMHSAIENVAMAHAANVCRLRSDAWTNVFDNTYQDIAARRAIELHLTSEEISAANRHNMAIYGDVMSHRDCRLMVNSQTMDDLDLESGPIKCL